MHNQLGGVRSRTLQSRLGFCFVNISSRDCRTRASPFLFSEAKQSLHPLGVAEADCLLMLIVLLCELQITGIFGLYNTYNSPHPIYVRACVRVSSILVTYLSPHYFSKAPNVRFLVIYSFPDRFFYQEAIDSGTTRVGLGGARAKH